MSTLLTEVNEIGPSFNQTLVFALVWVINNIMIYTVSSLTIGQYALKREWEYQHYDVITEILMQATSYEGPQSKGTKNTFVVVGKNGYSNSRISKVFANLTEEEIFFSTYGIRDKSIWFIDSLEAYDHLEEDLVNTRFQYHRNGFFCLIYTGPENTDERMNIIEIIFQRLFVLYVINVNVFLEQDNKVYVYTYFPYNKKLCTSSKPYLYYIFSKQLIETPEFVLDKMLFPHKVVNLYGCEVYITTWFSAPYIFIDPPEKKVGEKQRFSGIEGSILQLLADKMNFTINLLKSDRGVVYENGTATGSFQKVHDGEANITMGVFMYNKLRSDYLLATYSYLSTPVVVAIPKGRRMSPFQRLVKPFKYIIWSCFSTSILCGILIIFSLKLLGNNYVSNFVFGANNWMPFTNLWNSLYGGSIGSGIPRRNFARYLLAVWLMYTMVLRNAYIAELFQILQDGRAKTIMKTIFEAVDKNYTFFVSPVLEDALRGYVPSASIDYIDQLNYKVLLDDMQSDESKIVVVLFGPTVSYYNREQNDTSRRLLTLEQNLATVPVTMYIRHHSHFKQYLNGMLMCIMSAGLVSKELSLYTDKNLDSVKVEQQPIALTFWLLCGLFSVYLVLLLGCFLIFLLELWSRRSPLTRCILDFFNC